MGFLGEDYEAEYVDFMCVQRSAENTCWAGAWGGRRIWSGGGGRGRGEGPSEGAFGIQLWCQLCVSTGSVPHLESVTTAMSHTLEALLPLL